jgi:surface antigen
MPTLRIIPVLLVVLLNACVTDQSGRVRPDPQVFSSEGFIPLGTGLVGAIICNKLFEGHGSKEGWTAACGISGYFIGRSFTQQSDTVLERNPIGESTTWNDPDGGTVTMTPTRTYYDGSVPCREYRTNVEINGQNEILTGRACRQSDGTWRAVQ